MKNYIKTLFLLSCIGCMNSASPIHMQVYALCPVYVALPVNAQQAPNMGGAYASGYPQPMPGAYPSGQMPNVSTASGSGYSQPIHVTLNQGRDNSNVLQGTRKDPQNLYGTIMSELTKASNKQRREHNDQIKSLTERLALMQQAVQELTRLNYPPAVRAELSRTCNEITSELQSYKTLARYARARGMSPAPSTDGEQMTIEKLNESIDAEPCAINHTELPDLLWNLSTRNHLVQQNLAHAQQALQGSLTKMTHLMNQSDMVGFDRVLNKGTHHQMQINSLQKEFNDLKISIEILNTELTKQNARRRFNFAPTVRQ